MYSIPLSARIIIIAQLCVGLSCLLWLLLYPFMGSYFKIQSELMLIEAVIGKDAGLRRLDATKADLLRETTQYRKELFDGQDQGTQEWLYQEERSRQKQLQSPFLEKLGEALHLMVLMPHLQLLWVLSAVVIPIALLLRKAWALKAVWLLPLLALAYSWNNTMHGLDPLKGSERELFLQEELLNQQGDLESAWRRYLVTQWAHEEPHAGAEFDRQAIKGEYYFNLERIRRLPTLTASFWEKKSLGLLALYCIWNLVFALWVVSQIVRRYTNIPAR